MYVVVVIGFLDGAFIVSFFQEIIKSPCFLDSIGTSHKLESPVYLSSLNNISSEFHPGQVQTIPCLLSCHNFPYANLALLFSNPISGVWKLQLPVFGGVLWRLDWQKSRFWLIHRRVHTVEILDGCCVHRRKG